MEKSNIHDCLGDAVASLKTVPRIYIEADLRAVSESDKHDNSTLSYGPDKNGDVYHICHSRVWSCWSWSFFFSHKCQATVIKSTVATAVPVTTAVPVATAVPDSTATFVYTIELCDDCWYVGTTDSPDLRFSQHANGNGSKWTKRHPPNNIWYDELIPVQNAVLARLQEDAMVKQLMIKHGIDKVRGGSYCKMTLRVLTVQRKSTKSQSYIVI